MRSIVVAYAIVRTFSFFRPCPAFRIVTNFSSMKQRTHFLFRLLILAGALLSLAACSSNDDPTDDSVETNANRNLPTGDLPKEITKLEFPRLKGGQSIVIVHKTPDRNIVDGVNFSTEWDNKMHSQRWSCYEMYAGNTGGGVGRYPYGYPHDEDMPSQYQLKSDPYYGSGYQHGHICPSADRQYSLEANKQTFFLSNMQPQLQKFNEVDYVWEQMEKRVRSWNVKSFRDTLYVVKGGTIDNGNIIKWLNDGTTQIPVPKYFFAAVLCKNSLGYKAVGFWFEHKDYPKNSNLADFVVNIDELESKTGIDFFCKLPDGVERTVQSLPRDKVLRVWGVQ